MNPLLFYDFETQSLPLFKEPSSDPRQPHIVQVGACLVDIDTRKALQTIDLIVRPDGWEIPADVSAIHGITTEHAEQVGVPELVAVQALLSLWRRASTRCGHNELFDARIMRIALTRFLSEAEADEWKAGKAECTQLLSTPILKLPPTEKMVRAGFNKFKSANLAEAYRHFTGDEQKNAHSAMADVQACIRVYFGVKDSQRAA